MQNTTKNTMKHIGYFWLLLSAIFALVACDGEKQQAVAAGEHATLEQLAKAYRKVGEQYPVQPQAMPPEGRKKFLNQVFKQAGYGYVQTLLALPQSVTDSNNKDQRDLAELLLLPTKGLSDEALEKLYSVEELAAVKKLKTIFR
jgi:hypothetical protein